MSGLTAEQFIEQWYGLAIPKEWDKDYAPFQNLSINELKRMLNAFAEQWYKHHDHQAPSNLDEEVACCGNCHLPLYNIEWVPRVRMADSDICDYSPYKTINNKEDYDKLLKSGMFWEFYPELSGIYDIDKEVIKQNNNGTRMD